MNIIIWCSNKRDQITPLNIKEAYQTILVIFENFYPIYRIISEKLSLKSPNFYKDCMNVGMYAQFDQLFQLFKLFIYSCESAINTLIKKVLGYEVHEVAGTLRMSLRKLASVEGYVRLKYSKLWSHRSNNRNRMQIWPIWPIMKPT